MTARPFDDGELPDVVVFFSISINSKAGQVLLTSRLDKEELHENVSTLLKKKRPLVNITRVSYRWSAVNTSCIGGYY